MKPITCLIFLLTSLTLSSQIEISNIGLIVIDDVPETQQFTLEVTNTSSESIDLDWEVEKMEGVAEFLDISISDINLDYTPSVLTSCTLSGIENVLEGGDFYPMGLRAIVGNVPQDFDRDSILAYFHLYEAEKCEEAPLASIAITFNALLDASDVSDNQALQIYPNPASHILNIAYYDIDGSNYQIFDLQSRLVMQEKLSTNSVDISNLSAGGYIFRYQNISRLFFIAD